MGLPSRRFLMPKQSYCYDDDRKRGSDGCQNLPAQPSKSFGSAREWNRRRMCGAWRISRVLRWTRLHWLRQSLFQATDQSAHALGEAVVMDGESVSNREPAQLDGKFLRAWHACSAYQCGNHADLPVQRRMD